MAKEITIFAKKRTNAEGKTFTSYLTTLTKTDGSEITTSVKFRDEAGAPKADKCPMNISVKKTDANLSSRKYTDKDGNEATGFTLWVSAWKEGAPYVDHSLDDFDF